METADFRHRRHPAPGESSRPSAVTEELARTRPLQAQLNATLVRRQDLHPELSIVRVRPDQGPVPPFRPGQFVTIGLPLEPAEHSSPKLTQRPFSVTSAPGMRDYVELYVNLVREGALTPRLWTMHEGGRLYLKPVAGGTFTLDEVPSGKDLVMVATGTGLGPYISMLRHFRGEDRWRKFVIIHGVRKVADLGHRDELEAAAKSDASVLYLPTVTREGWPGLRGRVQDVLFTDLYPRRVGAPLSPEQCHVFLCGNPKMVEAVESELVARGFLRHKRREPGNVHKEAYW
jgi:ferredoxin--NADP+ reductase